MTKKILARLPLFLFILIALAVIFRWDIKTISYKEEVKLSDGSFIWVDIKRHYIPSTSALGDGAPFTLYYKPSIVEISWDTGFERVGKYTIKSNAANSSAIFSLDKYNNMWHVAMTVNRSLDFYKNNIGNEINYGIMVYVMNENGEFVKTNNIPTLYRNIMYYDVDNEAFVKKSITKFTWQDKLNLFNNKGLSIGYQLYPVDEKK